MEPPTKEDVKEYLKGLALDEKLLATLLHQLENGRNTLTAWKKRDKNDWKEELIALTGSASGVSDIYNYLHPEKQIPKLGEVDKFYDIFTMISSKPSSTVNNFTGPSFKETEETCVIDEKELILDELSQEEKDSILNAPNQLWRKRVDGLLLPTVMVGSTETVADQYVNMVITSVAESLNLDLRLEQQSFINNRRADHWVIAFGEDSKRGRMIGCNENKLPSTNYGDPFVLNNNSFLVQVFDQMTEVFNYYGTMPTIGIGSTGREWRFFKLAEESQNDHSGTSEYDVPTKKVKDHKEREEGHSPITTNIGDVDYTAEFGEQIEPMVAEYFEHDNGMEVDSSFAPQNVSEGSSFSPSLVDSNASIKSVDEKKMHASRIYKWDQPEMLFALGSVLKKMFASRRTKANIFDETGGKVMWHLVLTETEQHWGWATLKVEQLFWTKMIARNTKNVVVLAMLGKGADGKVLLVANSKGEVGAMKLVRDFEAAKQEAVNWSEVYSDYCDNFKWSVRAQKWMGIPAVIMPNLNQFSTAKERTDNLGAVRKCLERYHEKGYVHQDVYWRNIGYFKFQGSVFVVMLDLHPARVFKKVIDREWIDDSIERLSARVALS